MARAKKFALFFSICLSDAFSHYHQSRRRSSIKATKGGKDDSDSGWSDNENDSAPPPQPPKPVQRHGSFKPAVNKPPDKSKPPPVAVKTNPITLAGKQAPSEVASTLSQPGMISEPAVINETVVVSGPTNGVFSREAELEKQLEKTHSELIAARREKVALEKSVSELQDRLTLAETNGNMAVSTKQDSIGTMEANIRRGEREKDLEKQLVKVKKEKDKALRLIISLIGKVIK